MDGTAFTYTKNYLKVDEEGKAVVGGYPPDAFAEWTGIRLSMLLYRIS